jgi:hypothetical protein
MAAIHDLISQVADERPHATRNRLREHGNIPL